MILMSIPDETKPSWLIRRTPTNCDNLLLKWYPRQLYQQLFLREMKPQLHDSSNLNDLSVSGLSTWFANGSQWSIRYGSKNHPQFPNAFAETQIIWVQWFLCMKASYPIIMVEKTMCHNPNTNHTNPHEIPHILACMSIGTNHSLHKNCHRIQLECVYLYNCLISIHIHPYPPIFSNSSTHINPSIPMGFDTAALTQVLKQRKALGSSAFAGISRSNSSTWCRQSLVMKKHRVNRLSH